ncbi:MAG TPA: hypothetical protein VFW33_12625, partial [Gemmataceae bacterium]|nr:hypothetical protein [Gemmataceae bacterium]
MPIDVKCPQCGSGLDVPDGATGKAARCPECGSAIPVAPPPTEDEAGDVLLEGDPDRAIAVVPIDAPPQAEGSASPRRRRRAAAAPSLVRRPRNGPARVGSAFGLLSLVPGLALLFGPLALLLGLVGLVVGRFKGMARGTRDVVAALGLGLLTTAGNWGLVLYVLSVLGVPRPVAEAFHIDLRRPHRDLAGMGRRPGAGPEADRDPAFPHFHDPFEEDEQPNPARRKSLQVGEFHIRGAAFAADGKRVVVRHADRVDLWDLETEKSRVIDVGGDDALALSPDGKWLAAAANVGRAEVGLYDPETGECRKTLGFGGSTFGPRAMLAFSADGSLLAVSSDLGVRLWRTAGWEELPTGMRRELFDAQALALSPDGSTLAVGTRVPFAGGCRIVLWDTRQGKETGGLEGPEIRLRALGFAPDGKRLAAVGWDTLKVWDVAKGAVAWSVEQDPFDQTAAFSPDGRLIVHCLRDDMLALSDAGTGKRMA